MIVKGIIKSIDYSGNTCTVRIPIFESAANENEVVISAILSTLPGIYNGYKEEDVVFIAFENNDYDMPVVIGKLYLGVENEKNDPRGAIVCNNITAVQPISIPISSQLTLDNDPQHSPIIGVDKGIDSYKSIADLAKNLQKQDEKIGSLSVKVIDDGENLGAEIAKKVSITDETTKQRGLGWNLNTEKWEVYAKDSVGDDDKIDKFPIMTIDRSGMVIYGNLVLTGYPQTTEIKYTNSTDKNTPPTGDDVKWQDNTNDLYTDKHYIWKRTREVFYAYDAETDKWELTKYGDAHYECITGAKGDPGYTTVTVMLYKRSTASITGEQISDDLYYKFSDQKLYKDKDCAINYDLPEGWSYTISGTGDSSNGDLYCIAAVAHSNTDSDSIPHSEWSTPAKFVENGVKGDPGVGVTSLKTYYLLQDPILTKPKEPEPDKEVGSDSKWKETPDEYIDGYVYWLTTQTIYSDGHISYSDPVKDNGLDGVYEIAQGKSKNYYGDIDPTGSETAKSKMRKGDGWFDTAYHKINKPTTSTGYLQKYIKEQNTDKYILITSQNITEYISGSDPTKWPDAYSGPTLYQWSANGEAGHWEDVGGELITNKITANYINALNITTKKIHVKDTNGNTLFKANGIPGEKDSNQVTIGGFSVTKDALVGGKINMQNYCKLNILDTFKVGETDNKISSSSLVIKDSTWTQKCYDYYKDNKVKPDKITWETAAYDPNAGTTQSQQCLYDGLTTYKCNSNKELKNDTAGNPIISCMVLKPNKELIESKIKEALNIKDGEPIPTVTFSAALSLGIDSPSDTSTTINNNYDYIIASTPFSFADLGIEIGPDITNKDQFIQDKIEEAIKAIVDLNMDETNVDNQGKPNLSIGIFTGDGKIQEYARATGPRSIGNLENLTKVIYTSLTVDHYIAIFMVNIQKTYFETSSDTPIYDYDSSGNIIPSVGNKTTYSNGSNYTLPTYGYCCVPNSVEVTLQTLEIGTNFKVRTDGTMVANNAFFTGTLNVPEAAAIGGFNISKNTLTSSTLNIDSNKVTISSFKPLVLGSNFKFISAPDTTSTIDESGEETIQKSWKSKISSHNPLEILGESSILLSNTIASEPANNASILLEAYAGTDTTSASQEIRVVTTPGTELRPGFDFNTNPFNTYVTNNNIHFDNLTGAGGAVSVNYFTRATITATVYSNSDSTTAVEAKEAYKITVYYKFGTTWSSTTLAIPKGKTSASTTVSRSSTSTYPTYYGISKNSSSEAVIAGADNKPPLPPLKYTVYYKEETVSYIPTITANGSLTVKGDIKTTGKLTAEGNVYGSAFYASSDRELKTNIENINLDSNLDKFYQQLQPVKFNFKTDLTAQHFGFIAQDLKEALSIISTDNAAYSIVNKDDKTGYYRVNYNEMVALNAAQIKNIMNYIKDLQSQYEALKLKYKELEEKINENS